MGEGSKQFRKDFIFDETDDEWIDAVVERTNGKLNPLIALRDGNGNLIFNVDIIPNIEARLGRNNYKFKNLPLNQSHLQKKFESLGYSLDTIKDWFGWREKDTENKFFQHHFKRILGGSTRTKWNPKLHSVAGVRTKGSVGTRGRQVISNIKKEFFKKHEEYIKNTIWAEISNVLALIRQFEKGKVKYIRPEDKWIFFSNLSDKDIETMYDGTLKQIENESGVFDEKYEKDKSEFLKRGWDEETAEIGATNAIKEELQKQIYRKIKSIIAHVGGTSQDVYQKSKLYRGISGTGERYHQRFPAYFPPEEEKEPIKLEPTYGWHRRLVPSRTPHK